MTDAYDDVAFLNNPRTNMKVSLIDLLDLASKQQLTSVAIAAEVDVDVGDGETAVLSGVFLTERAGPYTLIGALATLQSEVIDGYIEK